MKYLLIWMVKLWSCKGFGGEGCGVIDTIHELAKAINEYHKEGFEVGYAQGFKDGRDEAIRNGVVYKEWKKYRRIKDGAEYYGFGVDKFRRLAEDACAILKLQKAVLIDCERIERFLDSFREPENWFDKQIKYMLIGWNSKKIPVYFLI